MTTFTYGVHRLELSEQSTFLGENKSFRVASGRKKKKNEEREEKEGERITDDLHMLYLFPKLLIS